jgi:hypothetical protein
MERENVMEWISKEEWHDIYVAGNRELLNDVLDRVFNKAIEQALCHIPTVVNKLSKKVEAVNKVTKGFFEDNLEFKEYIDIVLQTIQRTEIEYPGMLFEDILEKAKPIIQRKIKNVKEGMINEP